MASSLYERGYLDIWTGICFDGYKYHDSWQVHFKEEIGNYCNNFGSQNHKLFAFFHFCNVFFSLNIHTLPSYQLLKFQFSLKSLGIEILHPFGISDSLSWGELGYYLELHSEDFSLEYGQSGHS